MTTPQKPDVVRQLVVHTLREFGAEVARISELKETIFLNDGQCLARSYRYGGWMAMWLVEDQLLQFYDDQGNMLRTLSVQDEPGQQRLAA